MALVVRFAVEVVVVVAAARIPVVTPVRVKELTRTPVVVGQRAGGLSLGQARRSQTGQPEACCRDPCRRGDAFDIHALLVPRPPTGKTPPPGVFAGDSLSISLPLPGLQAPQGVRAAASVR